MDVIHPPEEVRAMTDRWRSQDLTVGLVPTMGALHGGHESLIRGAREECDRVVVSIFVNPLQFGPDEDLSQYPRDEARDLEICRTLGADVVWSPSTEQMFPPGADIVSPDPGPVGDAFEGRSRPGHFVGVLKAVRRLFDVTGPCSASFGQKDAQQLFLVRAMVESDALPVHIVDRPTVREPDGLAMSSRNARLSPDEREQAGCLFLGLSEAAALARAGERDAHVSVAAIAREVGATPLAGLDYAAIVEEATFRPLDAIDRPARAIVAARFGSTRLIDNLALPVPA